MQSPTLVALTYDHTWSTRSGKPQHSAYHCFAIHEATCTVQALADIRSSDEFSTEVHCMSCSLYMQGTCYGCGAGLQIEQPGSAGYVSQETYAVKKQHRQLRQVLCERCQNLSNAGMVPGVLERSSASQTAFQGQSAAQL